jgi:hypothetical protein
MIFKCIIALIVVFALYQIGVGIVQGFKNPKS